jgi:glycosyltransferase involved in cell wall biosynthesis
MPWLEGPELLCETQSLQPTNQPIMNTQSRRLRLAMVASSLRRGGAEKQTVYIARALHNAGVDLRFFYLGCGGPYETVLREMGVSVRQIYFPNQPWKILAELIKVLRQWRPEMVLVNQFGDLRYGAPAGRCCKALILGGVRSDGWYELRSHGCLTRLMLRLAHGFVANSHRARQTLASQGVEPQKMEVLPNVIDLREFDARSGLRFSDSLPAGRILVAAVGGLHSCKRFDRFLEALALARRSEPALAGVIAGADYGARTALEERVKALGMTPSDFIFLGECDRVPALLSRIAMLVLSSDYEGFPNVILEAMAARLPVITTPAGDASLVVQHGKTGYVVECEDTERMAAFMIRLARSPSMRMNLGEAGRMRVEQEYNYHSLSERLFAIFRRFADRQRNASLLEMLERGVAIGKTELSGGLLVDTPAA